jgi:oligoendopeptidase F
VREDVDPASWHDIEPHFEDLAKRELGSVEALERWLLDRSELESVTSEAMALRYIDMTCDTSDRDAEEAFLTYVEEVVPRLKEYEQILDNHYLDSPARSKLPENRYFVLDRRIANQVHLFHEENIPLETEDEKLSQKYAKTTGSWVVKYKDEEYTMQQLASFCDSPNRAVRQETWELAGARRLEDRDAIDKLFEEMVGLRKQIASNAGFNNYRDYMFRKKNRFDYGPEECYLYHSGVEKAIVPVAREVNELRRKTMQLDTLRPWDLSADPKGRPALRPFDTIEDYVAGIQTVFGRLEKEWGKQFRLIWQSRLMDLESRKGKAPGGYQYALEVTRAPFIFLHGTGRDSDLRVLLHEGGHAFHFLANRDEPLIWYRTPPMEFCEVASMTQELLGLDHLDVFYSPDEANRSRLRELEGIIDTLVWVARVDAFQQWLYTHPDHSRSDRYDYWLHLAERFDVGVDYSGCDDIHASLWHKQMHIFSAPFYYIEYGIAQLGALQVWASHKDEREAALARFKAGLALGGSRPLPEIFQTAGIPFDFSEDTLSPLGELVLNEIERFYS